MKNKIAGLKQKLTEAINVIKSGRRLSGEKKKLAERLGQFTTSSEASEALYTDLVDMRERFRNIGAYPDLVAAASMWDGKSELDPVEMARSYSRSAQEQAAAEANMTREEWEEAQAAKAAKQAAEEGTGSLFGSFSKRERTLIIEAHQETEGGKELSELVDRVRDMVSRKKLSDEALIFAKVSEETAQKIKEAGAPHGDERDFSQYHFSIIESALWHAYLEHCVDALMEDNQLNLEWDDFKILPDIVSNPDSVEYYKRSKEPALRFKKSYQDCEYTLILRIGREKRQGKSELMFKTEWVAKKLAGLEGITPSTIGSTSSSRTSMIQQTREECKEIFAKAKKNSTLFLAPNGKKSHLSPSQWLLVRTKAFKAWFGDWENDPANASNVLDENGEPLVLHHATVHSFNAFDKEKIGSSTDAGVLGAGFYFARNHWTHYGYNDMACFLNLRNPLIIESGEQLYHLRFENKDSRTKFDNLNADWVKAQGYDGVIMAYSEFTQSHE